MMAWFKSCVGVTNQTKGERDVGGIVPLKYSAVIPVVAQNHKRCARLDASKQGRTVINFYTVLYIRNIHSGGCSLDDHRNYRKTCM